MVTQWTPKTINYKNMHMAWSVYIGPPRGGDRGYFPGAPNCFQIIFTSMQVSVAPHSFDVAMASVSPPPAHDALELGPALMEVMR